MGRGVMIALAVSLGLNFLIAGYVLHDVIDSDPPSPPPAADMRGGFNNPGGLMRVAGALPPESRRAFRRAIRAELPDMRTHHQEMRRLRGELRMLMEAEQWDEAAVAQKMEDIRNVQARQRAAFDKALVSALGSISAEDRELLMEIARQRRAERRKGRRRPPE